MRLRKRMLEDLDQDIRSHLEIETQDNIDRGMSPQEARYAAMRKFGNVARIKEQTREVWSIAWLGQFLQDLKFGTRMLWRSSALTVAAVLAITLGVGINVGMFSVLNGLTLRLLPIPHAQEIVSVNQVFHFSGQGDRFIHNNSGWFSYSEYLEYRDHNDVFSGVVAYEPEVEATLSDGNVSQILGTAASCNYFDVLLEHPALGRGFADSDCAGAGGNAVAVVSDELWRNRFGADAFLVGKKIVLNRTSYTVVGVARPGFTGTEPTRSSFWVPLTMQEVLEPGEVRLTNDNMSWLAVLGRVRAGMTIEEVRANLALIAGRVDKHHPGRTTSLAIHKATFFSSPEERRFLVPAASVVLAAFALVLLIACANVASLLLARASVRQREIAVRLSLGAGRWRLMRQLLTESLLLSFAGGVLGSLIAFWSFVKITDLVISHLPPDAPPLTLNVAPNLTVLVYALGLTLITGIAFGLVPALQTSRTDLNHILKGDGGHTSSGKTNVRWLLNVLVGAQVAVCMILLLAAGLLLRGLYYAQTVDPGFDEKDVAQVSLNPGSQGYDQHRAKTYIEGLRRRIASLPGVVDVAQAECAPLSHDFSEGHFTIAGREEKIGMEYNHVSPEYFSTVGIPIVRGRGFAAGEQQDPSTVIVTESTARRLWPGESPLGKTLGEDDGRRYSVIGVAKDAQVSHLGEFNTMYLYFPARPEDDARTYVLVRYARGFESVATGIRNASKALDPNVPVDVIRLADNLEKWRAPSRIAAALSGTLGALALLLASIGVYGIVSYSVSRKVREIGVRVALGANNADVMKLVLRQSMQPVWIGVLTGVALCIGLSRVLSSMIFGISPHDPLAFIAVPSFLLTVALISSYLPARRALRIDPMTALRCE